MMNEPKLAIVEVPEGLVIQRKGVLDCNGVRIPTAYLPALREHLNKGMVEVNAVACGSTIVYNPRNEDMSEKASKGRTCYYVKILVPAKEGE